MERTEPLVVLTNFFQRYIRTYDIDDIGGISNLPDCAVRKLYHQASPVLISYGCEVIMIIGGNGTDGVYCTRIIGIPSLSSQLFIRNSVRDVETKRCPNTALDFGSDSRRI